MSPTLRRLEFAVTVEDVEHWPAEQRAAAEAEDGGSYDDWVVDQLDEAMRTAGEAFVKAHPDLFRSDLT